MIRRMRTLALAGVAAALVACIEPNPDHCGNLKGDSTCAARSTSAPFCDICTAANNGCVAAVVTDPACRPPGAGATEGASADTSDAGASTSTSEAATESATGGASTGAPGPICGDGELDPGELCDTDELNDATCVSLGYGGGDLTCGPDCKPDEGGCCLGVGAPCELNEGPPCCPELACMITGDLKEPLRCL